MPELTVAAGLARGLMEFAVSKGASRAKLVARSGIAVADLADIDHRIPLSKYVALMRAGKELANDLALALHYGETNDMSEVSVVGLIAYACETMVEAMVQVNRYARLVVEFDGPKDRWSVVPKKGALGRRQPREPQRLSGAHRIQPRAHDLRAAALRRDPARKGRACYASCPRLSRGI
jgi:hypothetical protein